MGRDELGIQILSSAEAIRRRPEMYVGPLDDPRLFNRLVEDALCIAVDEVLCGHGTRIHVEVDREGSAWVRDDGRGLPMMPEPTGRSLAERLFTELFACKAVKDGRAAGSCCRYGLAAVNALSEWLRVRNFRDGVCWTQAYERGEPLAPFDCAGPSPEKGLEIRFRPDFGLLGPLRFDSRALAEWFAGLGFSVSVEDSGDTDGHGRAVAVIATFDPSR